VYSNAWRARAALRLYKGSLVGRCSSKLQSGMGTSRPHCRPLSCSRCTTTLLTSRNRSTQLDRQASSDLSSLLPGLAVRRGRRSDNPLTRGNEHAARR